MKRIFVDTDVCLDLLTGRKPYNSIAERLFTLADNRKVKLCVSSFTFPIIDYVLRSQYKNTDPRKIITKFKTLVSVLAVDNKIIDLALASGFQDFEDAIQYNTALENNIKTLLTRNLKDYKKAVINVMNPESFLSALN